jgi:membrane-bound lytic murein transglycosylase D
LGLALAWCMPGHAWAGDDDADGRARIGPLSVSLAGRARVRGDRPEDASIHAGWIPEAHLTDRAGREALAAFERAAFPEPTAGASRIALRAPEPWMKTLTRPALPVKWTRRLVEYLEYFKSDDKGRLLMRGWLRRAGRWEGTIKKILAEHGVPEDLVFVALAESGFNPAVRSPVGAAGLWQFMEATGSVYGLERSYWVDDRHDPVKSTHAAALFFKDLKTRFGSWELALAAYNAGYGLVMTAIERGNTNDFWTLAELESGLPFATVNYVPKIVAAAFVGRNREAFDFGPAEVKPDAALSWVEVRVPRSTRLARVASLIDADPDVIAELNAQLVRGRTPPGRGSWPVRIPRDKKDAFAREFGKLEADHDEETTYRVRHGERLADIAARHGLSESGLRRLNGVRDAAEVGGGVLLVVPKSPPPDAPPVEVRPPRLAAVPPVDVPEGGKLVYFETTRATLPSDLVRAFGVTFSQIVEWNGLDADARLQAGQVLQLVVPSEFDPDRAGVVALGRDDVVSVLRGSLAHLETNLERRGLVRRGYRARKGDTLKKVARRFELTVGDLARINGFSREHDPEPGELLVVYVPQGRAGGTVLAPAPRQVYAEVGAREASTAETASVPVRPSAPEDPSRRAPKSAPARAPSSEAEPRRPGDTGR